MDSHFGSESTSKDSLEDSLSDVAVEPTKKTFFNVTIKSTDVTSSPIPRATPAVPLGVNNQNEREARECTPTRVAPKTKFFHGVSDWSERKESRPQKILLNSPVLQLTPKSFQEELIGTLERKQRMLKQKKVSINCFHDLFL